MADSLPASARATDKSHGVDPKALVGSGCLWAWVDALFMSAFFVPFGDLSPAPEVAAWVISLLGIPICLVAMHPKAADRILVDRRAPALVAGASGTAGSLLLVATARGFSAALFSAGCALSALFMVYAILRWGSVYCSQGSESAVTYVAGGFAVACLLDGFSLLLMFPLASFALAVLPVVSMLLFLSTETRLRTYPSDAGGATAMASSPSLAGTVRDVVGAVSAEAFVGLVLVMVGVGYLQHGVSFAGLGGMIVDAGVTVQIARGISSIILFGVVLFERRATSAPFRIGLLIMVAGFMLVPFMHETDLLWVCGALGIAGYTTVDVLVWLVVAQTSYARLADPLRCVGIMRILVNGTFISAGGLLGILLPRLTSGFFPGADAVIVGYLMTVAVVIIMASRSIWHLFEVRPSIAAIQPSSLEANVQRVADAQGLTDREREVLCLLAAGRSQPWIAERLSIAESTVNSHVRHIFSKLGVNSKQELIDLVSGVSTESIDVDP